MSKVTFCARNDVYAHPAMRKAANGVSYLNGQTKYVESDFKYGIRRCKQALNPLRLTIKGVELVISVVKVGYNATKKILF